MTTAAKWACLAVSISWAAAPGSHTILAQAIAGPSHEHTERSRVAFSHALPQLDGSHLAVTVAEINYGPGESSPPHSHPCPVIGFVVEGALQMQVTGEPEAIYKAGESFYEAPNAVHLVSANASKERPAKLLAYFVCDHDARLSVPVPGSKGAEGK